MHASVDHVPLLPAPDAGPRQPSALWLPAIRLLARLGFTGKVLLASGMLVLRRLGLMLGQAWKKFDKDMASHQRAVQQQVQSAHKLLVWAHGQQAASASEELSATAEELSSQAAQLQETMGFFRLADDVAGAGTRPMLQPVQAAARGRTGTTKAPLTAARATTAPTTFTRRAAAAAAHIDEADFTRF